MILRALFIALFATAAAAEKPVIAAVNYPLAYFAERLGGDAVEVFFPVPADRDPAFWRPALSDIGAMQKADLIALNGAGYAAWTTKTSLPRSRLVDTSKGFKANYIRTETITHSHGEDGEHSHEGLASHTWLDFAQAAEQAEALAKAMKRRAPADGLDATAETLAADLAALDAAAREAAAAHEGAVFIATHPRYQYFARAYGLTIHAVAWAAGAAPSDAEWTDLAALAAETGARFLIWEAAPPEAARARAAELGLSDIILPTLANRPATGDFLSAMRAGLDDLAALATTE